MYRNYSVFARTKHFSPTSSSALVPNRINRSRFSLYLKHAHTALPSFLWERSRLNSAPRLSSSGLQSCGTHSDGNGRGRITKAKSSSFSPLQRGRKKWYTAILEKGAMWLNTLAQGREWKRASCPPGKARDTVTKERVNGFFYGKGPLVVSNVLCSYTLGHWLNNELLPLDLN